MINSEKQHIYLPNQEPVANMKVLLVVLLAVVCQANTPITEQSWVKFRKVKDPTYKMVLYMGNQTLFTQQIS